MPREGRLTILMASVRNSKRGYNNRVFRVSFSNSGDFKNFEKFANKVQNKEYYSVIDQYAQKGVNALKGATPARTGLTASSWTYRIRITDQNTFIYWENTNVNKGINIAIILQYGHGTGTGGYVAGRDYINPAIRPIFKEIEDAVWKELND